MGYYYLTRYVFLVLLCLVVTFMVFSTMNNSYRLSEHSIQGVDGVDEPFFDVDLFEYTSTSERTIKLPIHDQEDEELIDYLRTKLIPPSPESVPYSLNLNEFDTSKGQGVVVRKFTNNKSGGFFVECGAGNGEFYSNTLFLEKHLGWTGLLVEGDPNHSKAMERVHRRAWVAPACMSLNTSAYESYFVESRSFFGKVSDKHVPGSVKVTCFPFYSFMLALNVTTIDYFSLDVEGDEVEILETIPFDKVNITVLSVEFSKSRGGLLGVTEQMGKNGYKVVAEVPPDDLIFARKDYVIGKDEALLIQGLQNVPY